MTFYQAFLIDSSSFIPSNIREANFANIFNQIVNYSFCQSEIKAVDISKIQGATFINCSSNIVIPVASVAEKLPKNFKFIISDS